MSDVDSLDSLKARAAQAQARAAQAKEREIDAHRRAIIMHEDAAAFWTVFINPTEHETLSSVQNMLESCCAWL